ncbi:MAG: DUF6580 family putative transport protein [Bacteroidota bacterium]|nr:hypothetical protein [Candidatus Kapabacteria bacterium]MDW8219815.1 DUF6580 family putative transport protein [Bacteroidota bacterium]
MSTTRQAFICGMIIAAALSRILPHPPNFAPINAIALFAGSYFADRKLLAFAVPLLAMLLSDSVLEMMTGWGFHSGMWVIYGCIACTTLIGLRVLAVRTIPRIACCSILASLLFFIVTNFAVWVSSGMYPHTPEGFVACYIAALPFFQNSLAGDAFYSVVLFGGTVVAERAVPSLRQASSVQM